jgi:hypothetical protein
VGCLITDFRTAGRRKFIFGGQVGETDYCTAHAGSDPNYLGMCLITDFRTAGRGKLKFSGQEGETDNSTALPGSDPNYLGKASMEGNAVVRCEFGHVGDGRRADSSTRFPGASSVDSTLR